MSKFFVKYSYFLLILPVALLLLSIKANLNSNFTPERVLYIYLILYLFSALLINKKLKFYYTSLIYIVSILVTYFEWCFVSLYHERINTSTIFILLETNKDELIEFVQQYLNFKMMSVLTLLLLVSFFILKWLKISIDNYTTNQIFYEIKSDLIKLTTSPILLKMKASHHYINVNNRRKITAVLVTFSILVFIYINANHHKQHLFYIANDSYLKYKKEKKKYNDFLFGNNKSHDNLQSKSNNPKSQKETYVLVIGESTTKTHLQLYNYYRPTNPLLSKIKKELVVFEDVISPHTHTIASLEKILTLANYENPNKKFDGTIIEIMKQAGFKTYWISNQIPVGYHETLSTTIAKLSDKSIFTNTGNDDGDQKSLDEKVLPHLEKILNEDISKKFIVIHLLGTHVQYNNRYPKSFSLFNDKPVTKFPTEYSNSIINYYDNAVLYNDYIIYNIIQKLKVNTTNQSSSLIYLSDHGDEVYDTVDGSGHNESNPTYSMFAIPFIYWSNKIEEIRKFEQYKKRKYMSDDLIFSVADIANVTFTANEAERSIFNANFKDRKRSVKDGKDFDQLFKTVN
ncbi:MAG: sulfatase-like hydrolase/transferase [Bacteroidota bacterium]